MIKIIDNHRVKEVWRVWKNGTTCFLGTYAQCKARGIV